jgi:4-hydroxy-3-methylbut-2-enyl diphosphate reductase IspH
MQKIERLGFAPAECFIDDDGILRFVLHGHHSLEQNVMLNQIVDDMSRKLRAQGKPVLIMVDVCDMTSSTFRSRQSAAMNSLHIGMDSLCYVGGDNTSNRLLLRLVLRMFDPNRFHYFDSEDLARKWLHDYKSRKVTKDRRPAH